jgi:hypothetical protein
VLILYERHEVYIVLAPDDEDALAGVAVAVRVFQSVEQVAALDVKDDVLERRCRALSFAFFASSQSKNFTRIQRSTMCAL